jgi:hypothetical protein
MNPTATPHISGSMHSHCMCMPPQGCQTYVATQELSGYVFNEFAHNGWGGVCHEQRHGCQLKHSMRSCAACQQLTCKFLAASHPVCKQQLSPILPDLNLCPSCVYLY